MPYDDRDAAAFRTSSCPESGFESESARAPARTDVQLNRPVRRPTQGVAGIPEGHTEEELLTGSESRIALTRLRSTLVLTFTTALLVAIFAPSPAFAASQSLALPQGDAGAILGHWCGGI